MVVSAAHKTRQIFMGDVEFDLQVWNLDSLAQELGRQISVPFAIALASALHLFKYNVIDY